MLTNTTYHHHKSVGIFLTVSLLHAALLYLLSIKGGLWLKPPHSTQPLSVSFVTEVATANKATTKKVNTSHKNSKQQQNIAKRSPNTKPSKPTKKNHKQPTSPEQTTQQITPPQQIKKPKRTPESKPEQKKRKPEPLEKPDATKDNSVEKKVIPDAKKKSPKKIPADLQPSKKQHNNPNSNNSMGANNVEPFSKDVISGSLKKDSKSDLSTDKNSSQLPTYQDEFDEYDASLKKILDGMDELQPNDSGHTKTDSRQDSNWGKLTNSNDSLIKARYKNRVRAVYPKKELSERREGIVEFEFQLDKEGKVIKNSINVVSSTTENFLREAVIALLASEFEVKMKNGVFINEYVKISITFSLDELEDMNDEDELDF